MLHYTMLSNFYPLKVGCGSGMSIPAPAGTGYAEAGRFCLWVIDVPRGCLITCTSRRLDLLWPASAFDKAHRLSSTRALESHTAVLAEVPAAYGFDGHISHSFDAFLYTF